MSHFVSYQVSLFTRSGKVSKYTVEMLQLCCNDLPACTKSKLEGNLYENVVSSFHKEHYHMRSFKGTKGWSSHYSFHGRKNIFKDKNKLKSVYSRLVLDKLQTVGKLQPGSLQLRNFFVLNSCCASSKKTSSQIILK